VPTLSPQVYALAYTLVLGLALAYALAYDLALVYALALA